MNKKFSEITHAKTRAYQRYRIRLSPKSYRRLCNQIKNSESVFIKRKSNTRTIHDVVHKGTRMRAVYDKARGCVVTFLHLKGR